MKQHQMHALVTNSSGPRLGYMGPATCSTWSTVQFPCLAPGQLRDLLPESAWQASSSLCISMAQTYAGQVETWGGQDSQARREEKDVYADGQRLTRCELPGSASQVQAEEE